MRKLAQELVERTEHAPDVVAVIDDEGSTAAPASVTRADEIAALLDDCQAGPPTVLVQADNSWRTLAAAVAVGLRGGLIAVVSGHADPLGVRAGPGGHPARRRARVTATLETWQRGRRMFASAGEVLEGLAALGGTGPTTGWSAGTAAS